MPQAQWFFTHGPRGRGKALGLGCGRDRAAEEFEEKTAKSPVEALRVLCSTRGDALRSHTNLVYVGMWSRTSQEMCVWEACPKYPFLFAWGCKPQYSLEITCSQCNRKIVLLRSL
jgi:hypothetical protein